MLSQNSPAKVVCPKVLGFSDMAAADIAGTSGLIGCFAFKLTTYPTTYTTTKAWKSPCLLYRIQDKMSCLPCLPDILYVHIICTYVHINHLVFYIEITTFPTTNSISSPPPTRYLHHLHHLPHHHIHHLSHHQRWWDLWWSWWWKTRQNVLSCI